MGIKKISEEEIELLRKRLIVIDIEIDNLYQKMESCDDEYELKKMKKRKQRLSFRWVSLYEKINTMILSS